MADLADQHEEFKKLNTELVTVSTDTQFVHLAWQRDEKLLKKVKFTMAADPNGAVSRLFGIYDEGTGLALRGTYLINPEGMLLASEVHFYNNGRNVDELLRKLKACIHLTKNPNEACPAHWVEGSRTLTPSPQMVGKVYEALEK
jgi:peroxiredoxin (alkyl hydroperoxide reductase subunit C)